MKIQLLKTEGNWSQEKLGCYVSVNNNLLDVITPLNSPHEISSISVPSEGILRLLIRDMGKPDGFLASLSIPLSLLNVSSGIWLPLQTVSNNDLISQLEDCNSLPRVMISVITDFCDDELFLTNQEIEPDSISEIVLASEIAISQDPENVLLKTSNFNFGTETTEKKQQEIIEILSLEIENYRQIIANEKESNENLKLRVSSLIETIKNNAERAASRESSLLELLNEKEVEISKVMELNRKLQNNLRKVEFEKINAEEKLERANSQIEFMKSVDKELTFYKEALKVSEINVEKLSSAVIKLSKFGNDEKIEAEIEKNCDKNEESHANCESNQKSQRNSILEIDNKEKSERNSVKSLKCNEKNVENLRIIESHRNSRDTLTEEKHENAKTYKNTEELFGRVVNLKNKGINDKVPENDTKKPNKNSPKKSILKPVCNIQKYTSVLKRSPSKEIKPLEKKKATNKNICN